MPLQDDNLRQLLLQDPKLAERLLLDLVRRSGQQLDSREVLRQTAERLRQTPQATGYREGTGAAGMGEAVRQTGIPAFLNRLAENSVVDMGPGQPAFDFTGGIGGIKRVISGIGNVAPQVTKVKGTLLPPSTQIPRAAAQAGRPLVSAAENKARLDAIIPEINKELRKVSDLGFDHVNQARAAILNYSDWAKRWDVVATRSPGERKLVDLANKYIDLVENQKVIESAGKAPKQYMRRSNWEVIKDFLRGQKVEPPQGVEAIAPRGLGRRLLTTGKPAKGTGRP
jgi:hypothetical protein